MMSLTYLAADAAETAYEGFGLLGQISSWILAAVIIAGAIGMVMCKELIHSALCLLLVMVGVAIEYATMGAPFVFVVQIVVYAGAVMVMILFIVMMVGARGEAADGEKTATGTSHTVLTGVAAIALLALIGIAVNMSTLTAPRGMSEANAEHGGNVAGLGVEIFNKYVVGFEVLSALLIVAAVGAMIMIFRVRAVKRSTQRELSQARFRAYKERGINVGPLAASGVYADSNAMDVPALLPDGSELKTSVNPALYERDEVDPAQGFVDQTKRIYASLDQQSEGEE
ncbi:NADH-quinone oxidoreductase subunit J [Corynebacterium glucuronolyticum]|uniref:NADH-quinone oxidoreductase subunit J n=1 Tax=Corynebacterium glucuronolyticum TaxID=39791 RepID=A0A7T4EDV4_9CORY|nr:NADH-quinone oxidoreductase subunit J [Corynebacterium glucuronolyticum]QQB45561.1 NADH-quinone oxidoreductase subunit J [Corynebacterium glucuronolyticum]WKD63784.1 NADH:ubiquinone oxidoreductase subunit J [Corynebacterium glucuronolyticum DSM 44120]SMB79639.1 NADH dehydrogenase subunit J [Corynebacterium glucuronolyticum]